MADLCPKIVADYFDARADRMEKSIKKAERKHQLKLMEGRKNTQAIYRYVARIMRESAG